MSMDEKMRVDVAMARALLLANRQPESSQLLDEVIAHFLISYTQRF
jgi:hypothetical protein